MNLAPGTRLARYEVLAVAALSALIWCAAVEAGGPPSTPCGLKPHDWCPAPPGDPCGAHSDERSCRADLRCAGLPYQGESVVACNPDGKGFWSNCPAVGCISRFDPPGRPPRSEVVRQLCSGPRVERSAEVHVWRTANGEAAILDLRMQPPGSEPLAVLHDVSGHRLLVASAERGVARNDRMRQVEGLRVKMLEGLKEAEAVPCGH